MCIRDRRPTAVLSNSRKSPPAANRCSFKNTPKSPGGHPQFPQNPAKVPRRPPPLPSQTRQSPPAAPLLSTKPRKNAPAGPPRSLQIRHRAVVARRPVVDGPPKCLRQPDRGLTARQSEVATRPRGPALARQRVRHGVTSTFWPAKVPWGAADRCLICLLYTSRCV